MAENCEKKARIVCNNENGCSASNKSFGRKLFDKWTHSRQVFVEKERAMWLMAFLSNTQAHVK